MQLILLLFVLAFCITVYAKLSVAICRSVLGASPRSNRPSATPRAVEGEVKLASGESVVQTGTGFSPANSILKIVAVLIICLALLIGGLVLLGLSVAVLGAITLRITLFFVPLLSVFFLGYGIYLLLRPSPKQDDQRKNAFM